MPAIIEKLVMRIGRSRLRPPSTAAISASLLWIRLRSANVTSRIAFATATPTAMIAPMADWMLSVVPVKYSVSTTPAITAGTVETTANASRNDSKFAESIRKMTITAIIRPERKAVEQLFQGDDLTAEIHLGGGLRQGTSAGDRPTYRA
jgi:hypothetical protein